MQPLSVILDACGNALKRSSNENTAWHADYCAVVDPASVLEMAIIIKSLIDYIESNDGKNIVTGSVRVRIGNKLEA
ncbi:hypothetical protein [Noviherbaspirillum saxi]|uniref:Uncharacterized protein n=1 Tax=Noviherbaspirillum saxi TaxID=2320863 RepID=A0A3A3FHB8_9BURK|nr:hypothetical protein [Noviherbaspirillum saxi]RJF91788.1 hypothetical protein D3871_24165 [Noviherbaspirillum saxi]